VWGTATREHARLATLRSHTDYVKALAYAGVPRTLASCSLDQSILLWDLAAMVPVRSLSEGGDDSRCTVQHPLFLDTATRLDGPAESSYCVAMNHSGAILASGCTENFVRVWDTRVGRHIFTLQGHAGHVRKVLLNPEGSVCVTGSSDGTVRVWDVGQRRCLHVCEPHDGGASVWAMVFVDESWSEVLSAGRDGSIVCTSTMDGSFSTVVPKENIVTRASSPSSVEEGQARLLAPLSLAASPADQSFWLSTTTSTLQQWPLARSPPGAAAAREPTGSRAMQSVAGLPGLIRHAKLNDQRHVATQDDTGSVQVWDVTKGLCERSVGLVQFDQFDVCAAKLAGG
jgi:WD repeat-containing protein 48